MKMIMNRYIKIITVITAFLSITSCNYLDVVPEGTATLDDAFSRPAEARNFLHSLYGFLPDEQSLETSPALFGSDEVMLHWNGYWGFKLKTGQMNTSDPMFNLWDGWQTWDHRRIESAYNGIRQAYIFLNNIDRTSGFSEMERDQMKGEAEFIIGYLHFALMRMYGPVVLINQEVELGGGNLTPSRSTYDECAAFVSAKMDAAADKLPATQPKSDLGRVTSVIAKAIKGKVLLYAASPLYNGNTDFSNMINSDGTNLISQTKDIEKWRKAEVALKDAINIAEAAGVSLYNAKSGVDDFETAMLNTRYSMVDDWNQEIIWATKRESYWGWQRQCSPRTYSGQDVISTGGLGAPLRMVELYYTSNGLPIDADPAFDYNNRFEISAAITTLNPGGETINLHHNREPRFYSNIAFDNGIYEINSRQETMKLKYKEQHGYTGSGEHYTGTGYLIKKGVHPETVLDGAAGNAEQLYAWPMMRLSELYLSVAEAINECNDGRQAEAITYLDIVREKAGVLPVADAWALSNDASRPSNTEGLRNIIQTERLIELAYEGHRFWDMRRWKRGEELNQPQKGLSISESGNNFYTVKTALDLLFDERKDYLWPIRLRELQNNKNLVQNQGW